MLITFMRVPFEAQVQNTVWRFSPNGNEEKQILLFNIFIIFFYYQSQREAP